MICAMNQMNQINKPRISPIAVALKYASTIDCLKCLLTAAARIEDLRGLIHSSERHVTKESIHRENPFGKTSENVTFNMVKVEGNGKRKEDVKSSLRTS